VYSAATSQELIETIVFGAMWGLGSVTFGIGTNIVGNSLGFSIILGLTSTLGSGIVMVALHPKEVTSPEGIYNWVALCVTVFGLVILGYAGIKKEQDQERASSAGLLQKERMTSDDDKPSFVVGLLVCLLSGALSPCLNLSLSFGHPIQVPPSPFTCSCCLGGASSEWAPTQSYP
jgi:L-rhamnose-H+ transport protein